MIQPFTGRAAIIMLGLAAALVIALADGCAATVESAVAGAVRGINVKEFGQNLYGEKSFSAEPVLVKAIEKYGLAEVVRVLDEKFAASPDAERRQQVMIALRPCVRSLQGPDDDAREPVLALVRRGLSDPDEGVALYAALHLGNLPAAPSQDIKLLEDRLTKAVDPNFITEGYRVLAKLGDTQAILAQLSRPRPDGTDKMALRNWKWSIQVGIEQCNRDEWMGEHMPAGLGDRLLALVRQEPFRADDVVNVLVRLQAVQCLGSMRTTLQTLEDPPARLCIACGIVLLDPKDVATTSRLPQLVADLCRMPERVSVERGRSLMSFLAVAAVKSGDTDLLPKCWPPCESLPEDLRGGLFTGLFGLGYHDTKFLVPLLRVVSDSAIRGALTYEDGWRRFVRHPSPSSPEAKGVIEIEMKQFGSVPGGLEALERLKKLAEEVHSTAESDRGAK
jgi:hypothetical protein